MDLMNSTDDSDSLRDRVRQWLRDNMPQGWPQAYVGASEEKFLELQKDWFRKLVDAGFATPHWPREWPGGGRPLSDQIMIFEELAAADAPRAVLYLISLYHAAMTLEEWGTPEQKAEHLPRILEGTIWCQGFSEPNAGSDLASLRTSAVRDGDDYIVNGQKIWSTMGHHADWCILLVRTSTDGPKQAGISFLLVDMASPGIETRPIRQITGDGEFAEIFFSDVRVPVANLVGAEGQGWAVAQTTLSAERGLTVMEFTERLSRSVWRLRDALGDLGEQDQQFRRAAVDVLIKIRALKSLVVGGMRRRVEGTEAEGDSSVIKLFYTEVLRDFTQLGEQAQGLGAQVMQPFLRGTGQETGNWMFDFLGSYLWSISGGSNEIQRGIVAQRVLHMPRARKA